MAAIAHVGNAATLPHGGRNLAASSRSGFELASRQRRHASASANRGAVRSETAQLVHAAADAAQRVVFASSAINTRTSVEAVSARRVRMLIPRVIGAPACVSPHERVVAGDAAERTP